MCISRTTTSKTAATFKPSAHLWRFRTTREFDNKNKASRESLREPRHDQNVFGNAPRDSRKHQSISRETCGTPANAKVFPARLAGVPANTKAFPTRLAGLPQTPKYFPRDLREYPQTPKHFPRDLREYPQTPKHFPWYLHRWCKHSQKHFGRYSTLSKPFFRD